MSTTRNNPSGKYTEMTDTEYARWLTSQERAVERLREQDEANAEAYRLAQTSNAAMRAWIAMRSDVSIKTDAQRAAASVAYIRRWTR